MREKKTLATAEKRFGPHSAIENASGKKPENKKNKIRKNNKIKICYQEIGEHSKEKKSVEPNHKYRISLRRSSMLLLDSIANLHALTIAASTARIHGAFEMFANRTNRTKF